MLFRTDASVACRYQNKISNSPCGIKASYKNSNSVGSGFIYQQQDYRYSRQQNMHVAGFTKSGTSSRHTADYNIFLLYSNPGKKTSTYQYQA